MKAKLLFSFIFIFTLFTIKAQNLVAYYPFNGNANDESGNANHGTVNGATLTTDRFGSLNSAYYFDGATNYISILNNPNINVQAGASYSISFWAKHDAQNNAKYMISKYKGSSGEQSYAIGTGSIGDSYSWYEFSPGGIESRGSIDLNDNQWHQITSVFKSGESVSIYVDGELDIQHPITHTGSISNLRNLTIGCGSNIAQFYKGSIDDVKIYNKALTVEEIKNEASDLVAYYPFNGNANDESGNGNNGTVNGATLTTDRFGNANSAYSFDGSDVITIDHDNLLNMDNELSISVWIKPNSQQDAMILGKSNYSTATNYVLRTQSNNFIEYAHKTRNFSNNNPLNLEQWNHIAVISHSTGEREIFINNNLTTFTSQADSYGLVSNLISIGAAFHFGSYFAEFFNGSIDDLRIYKSTLTESEIGSLFTNNTLEVEKIENVATSKFYVNNNTLYFKNTQNLQEIETIEVYNSIGQKMLKTSNIKNEITFKTLPIGVYILKVNNINNNSQTLRFLIN
jgi:hypothetical protein